MKNTSFAALLIGAVFAVSGSLGAHHSDSVFDQSTLVPVTGTVTRFEMRNPHSAIYFAVKNKKGQVEEWVAWGSGVAGLTAAGWNKNTFQPGDKLTIYGF